MKDAKEALDRGMNMIIDNRALVSNIPFDAFIAKASKNRATEIDRLVRQAMPAIGKKIWDSQMPKWLQLRLLKIVSWWIHLEVWDNPMAGTTEVWARYEQIGIIDPYQTML